jgi:hypothetical protein
MLALIAVIAIGSLLFLGKNVQKDLSNVGTKIAVPALTTGNDNNDDNNGGNGGNGNGGGNGGGHGGGHH